MGDVEPKPMALNLNTGEIKRIGTNYFDII